jgi:hypothetical protein
MALTDWNRRLKMWADLDPAPDALAVDESGLVALYEQITSRCCAWVQGFSLHVDVAWSHGTNGGAVEGSMPWRRRIVAGSWPWAEPVVHAGSARAACRPP